MRAIVRGTLSCDGLTVSISGLKGFAIPEPSTTMLFGLGGMILLLRRRLFRWDDRQAEGRLF